MFSNLQSLRLVIKFVFRSKNIYKTFMKTNEEKDILKNFQPIIQDIDYSHKTYIYS